jgi:threonine synthase
LLGDKEFAMELFGDAQRFTSANSISVGRLLPQAVYPFFAYSRIAKGGEPIVTSIPSGNFGDMMGTVLAREMGLPISKIVCGVNENTEFPDFLQTGEYRVSSSKPSPSSAMIVSHPSNLARLIDFYGGHMFDQRDPITRKVTKEGIIDIMPNIDEMRRDIFSVSVTNPKHYETMRNVFIEHHIMLDPHGAVGWKALEIFNGENHDSSAVVYETADPSKFPEDVKKATGATPQLPKGMKAQEMLEERIYSISSAPDIVEGALKLSDKQINEAKEKIRILKLR